MRSIEDLTDLRIRTERLQSEGARMLLPLQIDIEVSAICNLKCIGCPFTQGREKRRQKFGYMQMDLFKHIVDQVNWECTLVPWLNGEPLMHPDYTQMIKYIINRGHRAYITTNGTIWNQELFDLITRENSIYQIIFSLDGMPAAWSKSIELARPGSDRETIYGNIMRFGELKRAKGDQIDMAVKICRRGQDQAEIEKFIHYWLKKPYIDYVCEGRLMVDDRNPEGFRTHPCMYSNPMFMVIKWDGAVVPCSYNDEATNKDYFKFGNVDGPHTLLEIYNGEKMCKFRHEQDRGMFRGPCATCGFSYTGRGFEGAVQFRDPELQFKGDPRTDNPWYPVNFHSDYYNTFYSLKEPPRDGASWKI